MSVSRRGLHDIVLLLFAFASILFTTCTVDAADFDQERIAPEREWAVIVSPYVWAASLKGKASLAGFDTNVDVPFSEIFDHLDFVAMGNVEITNGQWGVYFDGQYVQTSQDEQVLAHEIGLDITTTTLSAGAFYKAYEWQLGGNTVFGKPQTVSIEPTIGLRWTELKADVEAFGLKTTKSADWTDPFVGLRVNADLTERWNVVAEADVGGFDVGSKISVNAQAYLGYRTMLMGHPTILRAGYRLLYQDYENDDFTGANKFRWDVSQHGPVLGLSMRF
ncbi:hypothetical protein [Rhizobium sp. S96]|uniref:hypothetical protein n=1 Tax=Rhizobium sp. S96 TaxID=3055140 RepID=UPI0025AAFA8F|nr:hypothetical protein [Rhizobium sp. S96]MDM9618849.1 hypothetical protein [Rhizobium sp. S96]